MALMRVGLLYSVFSVGLAMGRSLCLVADENAQPCLSHLYLSGWGFVLDSRLSFGEIMTGEFISPQL